MIFKKVINNLLNKGTEKEKKKILIFDDSKTVRSVLKDKLESGGYEVLEAEDGDTALKLVREKTRCYYT